MRPLWPSAAEVATLRFAFPVGGLASRLLLSSTLFGVGLLFWSLAPGWHAVAGLSLVLAGHLPLWVRTQTTAPGGATPEHEDVWAAVEEDWLERLRNLEKQGERWDTTPWDVSNLRGCLTLFAVLGLVASLAWTALPVGGTAGRLIAGAAVLLVPFWLSGMRTTWNPSELRKKGDALAVAREEAERLAKDEFDVIPMLSLREGHRGRYPVDARLMLRPSAEDASGFMGVQVQVALNNVRGTDYPYLYAVILGKSPFRFPTSRMDHRTQGVQVVFEPGEGQGVRYLVVRQHADESGGWHTTPDQIDTIVAVALERARALRRETLAETNAT